MLATANPALAAVFCLNIVEEIVNFLFTFKLLGFFFHKPSADLVFVGVVAVDVL